MSKLTVVSAFVMTIAMASGAGAITADGDWSDWFEYDGNVSANNWREDLVTLKNVNMRTVADEEGPTPGAGGQIYDIEQIFYYYEDADPNALTGGKLHIGLVTGFPPEGVPADDLYAGDFFIDIGGDGGAGIEGYDIAVATSTADVARGKEPFGDPLHNPTLDSALFGTTWANAGTPTNWGQREVVYPQFGSSNPYRVNEVGSGVVDVTNTLNTQINWGGMGVHNFLEISIDIDSAFEDLLTNEQTGGLGLHWTMECGNDVITVQDNIPLAPIPEPSTFALLGMGILGGLLRKKFTA